MRKVCFSIFRARWKIFFVAPRNFFARKMNFARFLWNWLKITSRNHCASYWFLVPKSRFRYLGRILWILGPKVRFGPQSAILGAQMRFLRPETEKSSMGPECFCRQCFFSHFEWHFREKCVSGLIFRFPPVFTARTAPERNWHPRIIDFP